jgi:hypothetical protein
MEPQLFRHVSVNFLAGGELNPKKGAGERLLDESLDPNCFFHDRLATLMIIADSSRHSPPALARKK